MIRSTGLSVYPVPIPGSSLPRLCYRELCSVFVPQDRLGSVSSLHVRPLGFYKIIATAGSEQRLGGGEGGWSHLYCQRSCGEQRGRRGFKEAPREVSVVPWARADWLDPVSGGNGELPGRFGDALQRA